MQRGSMIKEKPLDSELIRTGRRDKAHNRGTLESDLSKSGWLLFTQGMNRRGDTLARIRLEMGLERSVFDFLSRTTGVESLILTLENRDSGTTGLRFLESLLDGR